MPDRIFIITAFFIQIILLIHFAVRKLNFELAVRWGWIVYVLALPALSVSIILLRAREPWTLWLGGVLYVIWAAFGFFVDIVRPVSWRSPVYLPVFIPYVALYLGSLMFYWWPLGMLERHLWYVYAVLFAASTYFNMTSHK